MAVDRLQQGLISAAAAKAIEEHRDKNPGLAALLGFALLAVSISGEMTKRQASIIIKATRGLNDSTIPIHKRRGRKRR